jgi:hypothetical protein
VTLQDAHKLYTKRFPNWKMERGIYREGMAIAAVMMHAGTGKRLTLLNVKPEEYVSYGMEDYKMFFPQFIVDALYARAASFAVVCDVRIFIVDAAKVMECRPVRQTENGMDGYVVTLRQCQAQEWTSGRGIPVMVPEVVQEKLF